MIYSRKSRKDPLRTETLLAHVETVARLCEGDCSRFGLPSLGKLVGLIHDVGKSNREWQKYLFAEEVHEKIAHASAGARLLYDLASKADDKTWAFAAQIASLAVWGHHSGMYDVIDQEGNPIYETHFGKALQPDEAEAIQSFENELLSEEEIKGLLEKSGHELEILSRKIMDICNRDPYPDDPIKEAKKKRYDKQALFQALLTRMVYSCLIDNDRYAAASWENGQHAQNYSIVPSLWSELLDLMQKKTNSFPMDSLINRARRMISEECYATMDRLTKPSGIYRLNVVTGGGKTLAVTQSALNFARKFKKNHIFYIAPYTTIIDQTARTLRDVFAEHDVILEHHSNIIDEDALALMETYSERWDIPIVLTSQVQFFESLFSGRGQCARRMHRLCNSILIFDEIQSVPIKCISLFNMAASFLAEFCGCCIILCSATQPLLHGVNRPLVLSEPSELVCSVKDRFPVFNRTRVVDLTDKGKFTAESLASFIQEQRKKVSSILIILNTKKAVLDLYKELSKVVSDRQSLFHLSTSMCGAHRIARISEMRARLDAGETVICVSTNLIEAGVDISFDAAVRSLTGIESLAQAAGRCNRNGTLDMGLVYLIEFEETGLGMLPDLEKAQEATHNVLSDMKNNEELRNRGIFSEETLDRYYQNYYYAQRAAMDYRISDQLTLVDLLGRNRKALKAYLDDVHKTKPDFKPDLPLQQSFRTAGDLFHVIDNDATGVIVPYGNGSRLQTKLVSEQGYLEKKRLLREAQRYTVNVYSYQLQMLAERHAVVYHEDAGIYALNKEFYDDEFGVNFSGILSPDVSIL